MTARERAEPAPLYFGSARWLPTDWIGLRNDLALPFGAFSKHHVALSPWLYWVFGMVVVVGTSNAVNLTDGLDGHPGVKAALWR